MLRRIVVHFRSSIGTINVGVTEGCATQKTPAKVGDELDNDGEKQRCSEQWWRFAFLSFFLCFNRGGLLFHQNVLLLVECRS